MTFRYSLNISHGYVSCLEHVGSMIPHRLLHLEIGIRYAASLYPEITLQTFNCSSTSHHDEFLSGENARNIIQSMVKDSGATQEFIDTVLVPGIFFCAGHADSLPMILERQVMKLRVEILFEVDLDDEIGELIDASLLSSVNFRPASKSSIKALKRVNYRDNEYTFFQSLSLILDDHLEHTLQTITSNKDNLLFLEFNWKSTYYKELNP